MREMVIDGLILGGIAGQAAGLYLELGLGWACIAVGTELAALGVIGALRA